MRVMVLTVFTVLFSAIAVTNAKADGCVLPQVYKAASDGCQEGSTLASGSSCAPKCEAGYSPSTDSLSCDGNTLTPPAYTCQVNDLDQCLHLNGNMDFHACLFAVGYDKNCNPVRYPGDCGGDEKRMWDCSHAVCDGRITCVDVPHDSTYFPLSCYTGGVRDGSKFDNKKCSSFICETYKDCSEFTDEGSCTARRHCDFNPEHGCGQIGNLGSGDRVLACTAETCGAADYTTPGVIEHPLGDGMYQVEMQDGSTPFMALEESKVKLAKSVADECAKGEFFILHEGGTGYCLSECPPGYLSDAKDGEGGGLCKKCDGEINRAAKTCSDCPAGHLPLPDSDACMNMQDSCTPDQCGACADCLGGLADKAADIKAHCVNGRSCYHPGTDWCHGVQEELATCMGKSFGCYYKLMCQSACVCDAWKDVFCGGKTANEPCTADLLETLENTSERGLDESLVGKRTGGKPVKEQCKQDVDLFFGYKIIR